jgi:hypothetical protein
MSVAVTRVVKVRLTRKLAENIDGVDLSNHDVGDMFDLPLRKARLLLAEGWALEDRRVGADSQVLAFRREHDLGHSWYGQDDECAS